MPSVINNSQEQQNFAYNLKQLMTKRGLSPTALNQQLSEQYNWADCPTTIRDYSEGSQFPAQKRREQIAEIFGVTEKYMLTDHTKTITSSSNSKRIPLCSTPTDLDVLLQQTNAAVVRNDLQISLISEILSLPTEQLKTMLRIAKLSEKDIPVVNWFLNGLNQFR